MDVLVQKFLREPVFALATVAAGLAALSAEHVISGWLVVVALAVVGAAQRELVTPNVKVSRRKR